MILITHQCYCICRLLATQASLTYAAGRCQLRRKVALQLKQQAGDGVMDLRSLMEQAIAGCQLN
jgi:hypothetical protein